MFFQLVNKAVVFDGFFKIFKVRVKHEKFNGEMSDEYDRLVFERGNAVCAIVVNEDNKTFIFTRQFRAPIIEKDAPFLLECMAGMIDKDEDHSDAMFRELKEELGIDKHDVRKSLFVGEHFCSPGGSSEKIFSYIIIIGNDCQINGGGGLPSENEDIQWEEYGYDDIPIILDLKTAYLVEYAKRNLL